MADDPSAPGRPARAGSAAGAVRWIALAVLLTACTSQTRDPDPVTSVDAGTTSLSPAPTAPADLVPADIPSTDVPALVELVDSLNAAAAGTPAAQTADFLDAMDSGARAAQRDCPTATVTVEFQPVWQDVVADPEYQPEQPADPGTPYRIPAKVLIFSGGRQVGTDLALLHVRTRDGRATTFPLCLA